MNIGNSYCCYIEQNNRINICSMMIVYLVYKVIKVFKRAAVLKHTDKPEHWHYFSMFWGASVCVEVRGNSSTLVVFCLN